jgi:hypothetical protein
VALDLAAVRAKLGIGNPAGVEHEFSAYRDDPCAFAADVLGLKLWSAQRRALEAVRDHRRVSWRTGHGLGKSVSAATIMAWWACARLGAVIFTAPTGRQTQQVLWRALSLIVRGAKRPLGGELKELASNGWKFPGDDRFVVGFTADSPEALAGFHHPRMLVVVDEASGVSVPMFETIKGALTGDSRLFLVGNPTQLSGEFFESHGKKSGIYYRLHTSAYDSPNVTGECEPIPGLVDKLMIDEQAADYGEDSSAFAVRVLGEFPSAGVDSVISLGLVELARDRWDARAANACVARLEIGVDPARFGDDSSCIAIRRGAFLLGIIEAKKLDAIKLSELVGQTVQHHRRASERAIVRVDSTGLGGPVVDILKRDLSEMAQVIGIGAGESSTNPAYQRRRDELWYVLRDWLKDGGSFAADSRLEAELIAPRYTFSPTQKLIVESKDELRKRLRRSPDRADAVALAVYAPAALSVRYAWDSPFKSPGFTFGDNDSSVGPDDDDDSPLSSGNYTGGLIWDARTPGILGPR